MKKLLFGLVFGLVLFGTVQISQAMTMEDYFTSLKNNGLTDEGHRTVFIQTIWNNWSKSMQFNTTELTTPPFSLSNIMAFGPITLRGSDPNIAMMGNWQKMYITGHGVDGSYILGTNFNFLDQDQAADPTRARLYQDGIFKPFFKILVDSGSVYSTTSTVTLRNLYTSALVTYPAPTNIGTQTNSLANTSTTSLSVITGSTTSTASSSTSTGATSNGALSSNSAFGITPFGYTPKTNICSNNICIPIGVDPQNTRLITISSPNGGALYKIGDNLAVTWDSSKLTPGTNLTIYLYSDQGIMVPFVFNVPSGWNTTAFNLDSTKITPGQYRVLIKVEPAVTNSGAAHTSTLGINDVFDASDSTFTVGVNPATTFTKDLAKGSVSQDVKALQIFLISRGFLSLATPITSFGPATQTALIQYQKSRGITPANGKFNQATRAQVIQDINFIPVAGVVYNTLTTSITGAGMNGGFVSGSGQYASGTTATLTASTSLSTSTFTGWISGCSVSSTNPLQCSVTMNGDKTVVAAFGTTSPSVIYYPLTTVVNGSGTIMGAGTSTYLSGTSLTLTASSTGSVFVSWGGDCKVINPVGLNPSTSCTIVINGPKNVIANFSSSSPTYNTLTATTTGNGSGTITPGTATYTNGASVILTATPSSASSTFTGWTGCTASANNPNQCSLTMDTDKTVSANFIAINLGDTTYKNLVTSVTGAGVVSTPDIGDITGTSITYASGTTVALIATPSASSSVFAWWTGCASNTNQCSVTMNDDRNVVAHFVNSTTGTLPTTSSTYKRTLSYSNFSIGNDVKALQKFLVSKGFNVKVTSIFDKSTRNALMQYQQSRGITPADGKFGPATRSVVIAEINSPVVNPVVSPATNTSSTTSNTISDKICYKIPLFTNSHKLIEMSCTSSEYLKLNKVFRLEVLKTSYVLTPTVTTVSPATGSISGLLARYVKGTTATITAVIGDNNSVFSGWSGACSGTSTSCSVTMDGPKYVTATFIPNSFVTHTLNATAVGPGNIAGLLSSYTNGTTATITAQPSASSTFVGWSSTDSSSVCSNTTNPSCSIVMNGNKSVIANFATTTASTSYSILVARVSGHGTISNVNGSYQNGTSVSINAYPAANAVFSYWSGACTNPTSTTCTIVVDQNRIVTANFTDLVGGNSTSTATTTATTTSRGDNVSTFDLTTSFIGTGAGAVNNEVTSGYGSVTGPGIFTYTKGAKVTLTALPDASSTFTGWSGACTNRLGTCKVTMKKATSVTANFTLKPTFNLTISTSGGVDGGGVVLNGTSTSYAKGTVLELWPSANASSTFVGWSGSCTNRYGECRVTMTKDRTVTAKFKAK